MSAIEQKMIAAINSRQNWKVGNTEVRVDNKTGLITVLLHGNVIYRRTNITETFSDGNYPSKTTASRLRAIGLDCTYKRSENKIIINGYEHVNLPATKAL